jgi:hypothetical protein
VTNDPIARYLSRRTSFSDRRFFLRPMKTGEMLDLALRCYQRLGWTYLRLTAISALLCLAAYKFDTQIVFPAFLVTKNAADLNVQLGELVTTVALALFVAGPLFVIALSWSTCIVCQLVSDTVLGNMPSPMAALATARRAIWTVFRVNLYQLMIACAGLAISVALLALGGLLAKTTSSDSAAAGLVAFIGIVALIISVFFFLGSVARYALAAPIVILEGGRVKESARRSVTLQKPFGYHAAGSGTIWGLFFLSALVFLLLEFGIGMLMDAGGVTPFLENFFRGVPFGGFFIESLGMLPAFLAIWTIIPFWAATVTILYYERRVRLEGYDIEALAADVWRTDHQARFEL